MTFYKYPNPSDVANLVQRTEARSVKMVERAKVLQSDLSIFASAQIGDKTLSLARTKQTVRLIVEDGVAVVCEALPNGSWMVTPGGGDPRFTSEQNLLRVIEEEAARLVTTQVGAGG